jgi:hypothetical protein
MVDLILLSSGQSSDSDLLCSEDPEQDDRNARRETLSGQLSLREAGDHLNGDRLPIVC